MRQTTRMLSIAALLTVGVLPGISRADTITITAGSASLYADSALGNLTLTGPGTSIVVDARNSWSPPRVWGGTDTVMRGSVGPIWNLPGYQMEVNGVMYHDAYLAGEGTFASAAVHFPEEGYGFMATVPVTLIGHFTGYSMSDPSAPLFAFDLELPGTFSAGFSNSSGGPEAPWIGDDATLTLASQTPEPASLLLLGTGLAGMAAARRRRCRADHRSAGC